MAMIPADLYVELLRVWTQISMPFINHQAPSIYAERINYRWENVKGKVSGRVLVRLVVIISLLIILMAVGALVAHSARS